MYSLGSPKALTQFLYQRLCLPFFGDVGEKLSVNTQIQIAKMVIILVESFLTFLKKMLSPDPYA